MGCNLASEKDIRPLLEAVIAHDISINRIRLEQTFPVIGRRVLNLAANGVGYAMDENNAELVSAEMQATVDAIADKIVAGDITVHDYMSDESCPALSF